MVATDNCSTVATVSVEKSKAFPEILGPQSWIDGCKSKCFFSVIQRLFPLLQAVKTPEFTQK